jgi:hypothetical protein
LTFDLEENHSPSEEKSGNRTWRLRQNLPIFGLSLPIGLLLKLKIESMKAISKILVVCGLMIGGLMIGNTASAQNDAASTKTEKAVTTKTAQKTCTAPAAKSCCAQKAAMGGSEVSTSANGGASAAKSCAGHGEANAKAAGCAGHGEAKSCCTKTGAAAKPEHKE